MSRSYKKFPKGVYIKKDSELKKAYNRRIRRTDSLEDIDYHHKSGYKKLNDSCDIEEWSCYVSWEDWWNGGSPMCSSWCEKHNDKKINVKNCKQCWKKFTSRK